MKKPCQQEVNEVLEKVEWLCSELHLVNTMTYDKASNILYSVYLKLPDDCPSSWRQRCGDAIDICMKCVRRDNSSRS